MIDGADQLVASIDVAIADAQRVIVASMHTPAWSVATLVEWSLLDARKRAIKLLSEVKR